MSSSQFDDLLGDFGGDSSTTMSTTTKTTSNGDSNSELLLDFGGGAQVTNGQSPSNGVNPLYDLDSLDTSSSQQPQSQSSNPLYDLDFNTTADNDTTEPQADAPQSSNPLYDFENTTTTTTTTELSPEPVASSNPFQDFEDLGGVGTGDSNVQEKQQEQQQDSSLDFLSSPTDDQSQPQPPQSDTPNNQVDSADLLGDFNDDQPQVDESNTMQEGDSGIQSEHNGSSSLLDDFTNVGVTVTTTQDQEEQPDDEEKEEHQQDAPAAGDDDVEAGTEKINEDDDVVEKVEVDEDEGGETAAAEAEPLPDLVVKEEGDEDDSTVQNEVAGQDSEEFHQEDAQVEETRTEEESHDAAPVEEEVHDDATQELPHEEEEGAQGNEAPEEEGARSGDYSADRREEDLEQYCIDREEETSEVAEGVEAATDECLESTPAGVDEMKEEQEQQPLEEEAEVAVEENQIVEGGETNENLDQVDGHNSSREEDVVDGPVSAPHEGGQECLEESNTEPEAAPVDEPEEQNLEQAADAVDVIEETVDDAEQEAEAAQQGVEEEPVPDDVVEVVEEAPSGQPEEAEDDIVEVATTTEEDRPQEEEEETHGLEESNSNETQEPTPSQWPPVETSDQPQEIKEPLELDIQEEPAPTVQPVETKEQEVMSSNGIIQNQTQQWDEEEDDEEEEGVYENEPVKRDDVARESDKKEDVNLPSPGLAQNLLAKFNTGTASNSTPRSKREVTPPNPTMGGGEYISEPRVVLERYEGKAESGVFESEPQHNPEVVRSDSHLEEAKPEQGSAKKFAARYAQIDQEGKSKVVTSSKEVHTDRDSGPVEYVSEPRGFTERYEGKAESGVFESQPEEMPDVVKSGEPVAKDPVPERGTAKNLAQRFHQISVDSASPVASSRNKRELTPDQSGRCEYVSEPRAQMESYQAKVESGVFENTPQEDPEVVKSETAAEEYVPERGYAKNVAAKFKELESTAKSPPLSPGRRKEFTPPREDQATSRTSGVYESTPESKPDVITAADSQQEVLPGAGTARSLAQRYKEIEAQSKSPVTSKPKKELTPPPKDAGVYENKPERFQADYNRPAESGILENTPAAQREDVLKASEGNTEVDLPEAGSAKNLVNRWRQIESESAKNTSPGSAGGRHKEFTPPREEPRISQNRNRKFKSPRTPKSPAADSNHQLDNGSVHPSDLPGQYQPQNEPHVFESNPEPNPDALREADTDKSHGLPKKNQAKKMLARFQSIQDEANKELPKPVPKKQQESDSPRSSNNESDDAIMEATRLKFEDPDQVGRSKSMRAAIQVEKCGACDKTVYAMERLEMNKRVYHRACFRCSQCKAVLTPKTFAINNEVIFCTTHYKQNFTTKGNYDEGFGRQQHKKHWNSNPNLANSDSATTTTTTTGSDNKS